MARDRLARPLAGDIRIEVRDAKGSIRILVEREKIAPRHLAMVKALQKVIANPKYWADPKARSAAPSTGGRDNG